ncbi:MAG TPA: glutamate-1-semialdehyde-2,1-aminomutase [Deltaproteobacteria bacterium]|nr:glutamate-1-semialdehyde-2,1-aminomutase [Deltaproteobacteria bacterium]
MSRSTHLLARAMEVIPGGVNSPVRAFNAVGGDPPFIARGEGCEVVDVDGHHYLDLVGSWGPLILGHADTAVLGAAMAAASRGSSFGAPTEGEIELAEEIVARVPSVDKVRLCSSGTEATMHALRLSRGVTGRDLIVKLEGCYHGAHDGVLVKAGSGVATFSRGEATAQPGSPGVPAATAALTLVAPFNDPGAIRALLEAHDQQIAAVILEPVAGNMGCVPPAPGYLQELRRMCTDAGTHLIFDEVMTGFRVGRGSAQERFGVTPDLTCMGKVVGGGYPLAAFGGSAAIMDQLAPLGPIYQAGTLSGNPVAVAAGRATLRQLDDACYERLETLGDRLEEAIQPALTYHKCSMNRVGSMFTVFFRPTPPTRFDEVQQCDLEGFGRFFRAALNGGVYLPPSQYEAAFLPARLTDEQLDRIVDGLTSALVAAHVH